MMTLMYEDGDDDGSAFVNIHHKNVDEHFNASCVPSANDDNIPKILQCASTLNASTRTWFGV
eukprot:scaffold10154_cov63-Cyclotella_meneghiniana.AAC.19